MTRRIAFKQFATFATIAVCLSCLFSDDPYTQNGKSMQDVHASDWRHLALSTEDHDELAIQNRIAELQADGWQYDDVASYASQNSTPKTVYYFKRPS